MSQETKQGTITQYRIIESYKGVTYEEAYPEALEYFNKAELPAKVFLSKYALKTKEGRYIETTPADMHLRLSHEFARIDANNYGLDFNERRAVYLEALRHMERIVPQGSPMAAIGNQFQMMSASNCVVVASPEDSMEGIFKAGEELAQLMKRRCGVGLDCSTLRPEGMRVNNAAKTTSGAWTFCDFYSYVTRMVCQSGRRGALMLTMDVHHPDIKQFITMKMDKTKVTGANVSVRYSDEFMLAVVNDTEYEQRWPLENPVMRRKVRARDIWDLAIKCATDSAEPGCIFWDTITNYLPAHSYERFKTVSTNPCCFAKDSDVWVVTKEGIKEIKNITAKDQVWIDSDQVWAKTSGYFDAGLQDVYKVKFSNNEEFLVTGNHKFEVTKARRSGTKVVYDKTALVELNSIEPGDRVSVHVNAVTESQWGKKGTYKEGLILGWLSGDGCLSYKNHTDFWPTLYLPFWDKEHDVADKLLSVVNSLGYGLSLYKNEDGKGNNVMKMASSRLTRDLTEKYEINLWKFKKGFNPFLYDASEEFISGYLSAYLSADGTVTDVSSQSRYSVQLASVEKVRLEQVKNLLLMYGIKSSIGLMHQGGKKKLGGYSDRDCYRLSITGFQNLKRFYERIGFISGYKQEALGNIVNTHHTGRPHMRNFIKVESVEAVGEMEVGCINVDTYHKFTANGVISGNSEIALSPYDSCRLISMNLTGYVVDPFLPTARFDWDLFQQDITTAMQMSDNLVDLELECIRRIMDVCSSDREKELWQKLYSAGAEGRRIGLGTHALGDMLAQLGIKYDSDEALKFVDGLYSFFSRNVYNASIDLAEARGPFIAWDWEIEKDNDYIKRLPADIQERAKRHGRRNIACMTQAPTGTVSLCSKTGRTFPRFSTSSGVEPLYAIDQIRRKKVNDDDDGVRVDYIDELGDKWQEFKVYHPNVANYLDMFGALDGGELPDYFVQAEDIDWKFRVRLQGIEQKYIDHSISSTINLPRGTKADVVGGIYLDAWKNGLKGVTVYVDGSRDQVIRKTENVASLLTTDRPSSVVRMQAPKRPKELVCDIHHTTVKGDKYVALVGLFNDEPYELFGGFPGAYSIPKKYKTGRLIKKAKGKYRLHIGKNGDSIIVDDIAKELATPEMEWITRLVSTSLRHGTPIDFLCEQLGKTGKVFDFNKVISRVLKKYIKNGQKVRSSLRCSECHSTNVIYQDGCPLCRDCGNYKCG